MFHAQEIDLEGHGGFEMDVRTDGWTASDGSNLLILHEFFPVGSGEARGQKARGSLMDCGKQSL